MKSDFLKRSTRQPASQRLAAELRGFGPAGIFAFSTILLTGTILVGRIAVPFSALFVLLWAWFSHTPWRKIGYVRPNSWIRTIVFGIAFGILFKLLTKAVIMPLLGADPINRAYHYLAGNNSLLPAAAWTMLVAGFAEETVFRGYLFERLGMLLGKGAWARIGTVLITSAWFGLVHYMEQGVMGVIHATIVGLVFGTLFAITGRIFPLMVAHAAYDLTALVLIYQNWELDVSRFFFDGS